MSFDRKAFNREVEWYQWLSICAMTRQRKMSFYFFFLLKRESAKALRFGTFAFGSVADIVHLRISVMNEIMRTCTEMKYLKPCFNFDFVFISYHLVLFTDKIYQSCPVPQLLSIISAFQSLVFKVENSKFLFLKKKKPQISRCELKITYWRHFLPPKKFKDRGPILYNYSSS